MELAFITSALRRYLWIVVASVVLAAAAGTLISVRSDTLYRSDVVLLVMQPSESQLTVSVGGDAADRYVAGQLSVLRSQVMAERVAEEIGGGTTRLDVVSAITVSHEPGTDVVTISADTPVPERSQEIASTYVDVYFDSIRAQLERTVEPLLTSVDEQMAALREEIAEVDEAMIAAMRPYITSDPVPSLDQIAPGLVSEKNLLLGQLQGLQASATQLRLGPRVASEIVQQATLPSDPIRSERGGLLPVAVVAGGLMGVVIAVVVARFSPHVMTDEQAEEILGRPIVARVPARPDLRAGRDALLDPLPLAARRPVESISVRAGSTNPSGTPVLSIVVVGTQTGAGTTTLAAAMARYFADNGARVLLIDGDHADPELTNLFVEGQDLVAVDGTLPVSLENKRRKQRQVAIAEVAPTDHPFLHVGSLITGRSTGGEPSAAPDTRVSQNLDASGLLLYLAPTADVVIVDGGPLLGSVSTVQFAHHCDAVVLAMPTRQSIRGLEVVAAELRERRVLPVWMPVRRHRRSRRGRAGEVARAEDAAEAVAVGSGR